MGRRGPALVLLRGGGMRPAPALIHGSPLGGWGDGMQRQSQAVGVGQRQRVGWWVIGERPRSKKDNMETSS